MHSFTEIIKAMFPKGSVGDIDDSGDLHKIIEGMADNHLAVKEFLNSMRFMRDPLLTELLYDLEIEYGVLPNDTLPDENRRGFLNSIVYSAKCNGTLDYLYRMIEKSSVVSVFDISGNDPCINPSQFVGGGGGELVANDVNNDSPYSNAVKNKEAWSFIFFVGGEITRSDDGSIVSIVPLDLTAQEISIMREIILRYKPLHSWCVLVCHPEWDFFTFSDDDTPSSDTSAGFSDDEQLSGGWMCDEYTW